MKIAFVAYADPEPSYQSMPRGTFAYLHYLGRFGHEVRFFDRRACRRPARLLADLRAWPPDVCLAQHLGAFWLAMFRRTRMLRVPWVHAWDDYYAEQSRFPRWLMGPLERISVTGADHVTSVSRYNVHRARAWGISASFLPHGVEAEQRPGALTLPGSRFKAVYLGDQALYKGMRRLVEAMRGLDADLFMVGTVNPALRDRAPANVHFVGRVPPQEVQAVLGQADVLVNPSDQDSNFKLQEYIRAGKPILGVEGRMAWAFEHGRNAWLCSDLGDGMRRLAADPALRATLADGVRALPVPTWEQVGREMEAVLARVCETKAC
jgi:glycosyltransferase involved in cell wall biosynthesis